MKKLNDKNSELVEKIINVIYLEKGLSKNTKSAYKSDILLSLIHISEPTRPY